MSQRERRVKTCPECGDDLTNRDPVGHAYKHYGVGGNAIDPKDPKQEQARERYKALTGG